MSFSSDAEIIRLTRAFRTCTLPGEAWTHAAHWAAALALLSADEAAAFRDMPDMIRSYNLSTGRGNTDTEGYHETITLASLRVAADALHSAPADTPLHKTLDRLLAGPFGRPDWPLVYWSRERLFSVAARRTWVEPDLAPFAF